jgi:hypothetical protein
MDRALMAMNSIYLGLAVAHWCHVARLLHDPPRGLWCGNVVTDPYHLLMNGLAPIVAGCVVTMLARRRQARRRPYLPPMALPLFLGTTAGLFYEADFLRDYGFGFSVWWFPWLGFP